MHRLIAAVIREQTWDDQPASAVEVGEHLVLAPVRPPCCPPRWPTARPWPGWKTKRTACRNTFPPGPTTVRVGAGEGRARPESAGRSHRPLRTPDFSRLINCRTGPAIRESAESLIGLARSTYQNAASRIDDLRSAHDRLRAAD